MFDDLPTPVNASKTRWKKLSIARVGSQSWAPRYPCPAVRCLLETTRQQCPVAHLIRHQARNNESRKTSVCFFCSCLQTVFVLSLYVTILKFLKAIWVKRVVRSTTSLEIWSAKRRDTLKQQSGQNNRQRRNRRSHWHQTLVDQQRYSRSKNHKPFPDVLRIGESLKASHVDFPTLF